MNGSSLNPHLLSPRGFRTIPHGHAPVTVPAGSVWGRDDVDRLRRAAWVVVGAPGTERPADPDRWGPPPGPDDHPGSGTAPGRSVRPGAALPPDDLWAATVASLALAGVPTATSGLPEPVRARLAAEVLRVGDLIDASTTRSPDERERLSLALRRAAWATGPGRWFTGGRPRILVLLPADPPPTLIADLAAQTWDAVTVAEADPAAVPADARYVTRLDGRLRYSPHHLGDLVHGLTHSRATVAHSPDRYRPWGATGAWLEADGVAERAAAGGLTGGSLWHAADGLDQPEGEGYAVHGGNAVSSVSRTEDRAGVLRRHEGRPALLAWLDQPAMATVEPAPSCYPARKLAAVPGRARTSATASAS